MKNRLLWSVMCLLPSIAFAQVVDTTVCDVLRDPVAFDGKIVRMKAVTAVAGFDEFVIEGPDCKSAGAIWLAYPEGSKGKAAPSAIVRLQLAKNAAVPSDPVKRAPVVLQRNADFERFDALLAEPHKSRTTCLGCPRNQVSATVVGRLDAVKTPGLIRDASGKIAALSGFGNLNLYGTRLVLQAVSDVVPHEIDYSSAAPATKGDLSRVKVRATREQLRRAVEAFGAQGEDNGVNVGFGRDNEVAKDEGTKSSASSPDGILFNAVFDMKRLSQDELSAAMAHVGTHIADVRGNVPVHSVDEFEERAWQATFK